MKIYNLHRKQFLPIDIQEAWSFFSSPKNLKVITPPHMGFYIHYVSGGEKMYPGQIIRYEVNVLPFLSTNWVTEITHVHEPFYFVDEQRVGPYSIWHHQHHFKEVPGGVEITDDVNYAIPFGLLGRLANLIFVSREVSAIFDFRYAALERMFSKRNSVELAKLI